MQWSKENRLDLLRSAKMAASRYGVTPKSKRAPVAHHAQATGAFLLRRQGDGVVELDLWNCSQAALHAFAVVAGKYRSL
jgi:hypothetical protein